jgi:outer membrane protein assembly factor BamB
VWTSQVDASHGGLGAGLAVQDGLVYTAGAQVVALRAADGSVAWSTPLDGLHVASAPAVAGGAVVVAGTRASAGEAHGVVALDARSGGLLWQARLPHDQRPEAPIGSPVVAEGRVLVPLLNGLAALAQVDGSLLWRVDDGSPAGSPTWADGLVLYGDEAGLVRARRADGTLAWSTQAASPVVPAPLAVGGTAYVVGGGALVAMDVATGERRWTADVAVAGAAPAAWSDGRVIVAAGADLLALDAGSGAVRWRTPLPAPVTHGLAARGGEIAGIDMAGHLILVDARAGAVVSRDETPLRLPLSAPAWDGGRVYALGLATGPEGATPTTLAGLVPSRESSVPVPGGALAVLALSGGALAFARARTRKVVTGPKE